MEFPHLLCEARRFSMENTLRTGVGFIRSIQASIGAIAVSCAFALTPLSAEFSTNRLSPSPSVAKINPALIARKRDEINAMDELVNALGNLHEALDSDYESVQNNAGNITASDLLIFQSIASGLTTFIDNFKPHAKDGLLSKEGMSIFNGLVEARMKSLRVANILRQKISPSNIFEGSTSKESLVALSLHAQKVETHSA